MTNIATRETEFVSVDMIESGGRARAVRDEAVQVLMTSMAEIGLKTPISVRYLPERASDAHGTEDSMVLVSGGHRLEAARRLGWKQIECFIVNDQSDDQARMWEIAENLHRAELSALERSEHIAEWVKLAERVSRQVDAKLQAGRPEGGTRKAARELGLSEPEARRAVAVAGLSEEAKEVARKTKLDGNQSVLLAAAKSPDNVAFLKAEHARREAERQRKELEKVNKDQNRVVEITEAEHFANWLMERTDLHEMPTIISWLEGTKPKEVIAAMRRRAA